MNAGLKASGICVDLGGRSILSGVDFSVAPGEVVGLIGPNGAGKSTLLRAILGLVPLRAGEVTLEGATLTSLLPKDRARRIAYAPQGAPVHWPLTAERLVALGRVPHLTPYQSLTGADEEAVNRAFAMTETAHLRHRIVTSLSGGERAGVLLARAIAVDAPYFFADEPVAALDPYHQIEVMEILKGLAGKGRGVVVVLHDLALAMRSCTRLYLLNDGAVAAEGPPGDVLTAERLEQVYRIRAAFGDHNGEPYLLPWMKT